MKAPKRPIRKPQCRKILANGQRCKNSAHGTLALYCARHSKETSQ